MRLRRLPLLLAPAALLSAGCAEPLVGPNPPSEAAHFPTGLAFDEARRALLVVSSNHDLRDNRGALLSVDLSAVQTGDDAPTTAAADAYESAVFIPSFGGRPAMSPDGSAIFVPTRETNTLIRVDRTGDGLRCGTDTADCADDNTVQAHANDPSRVLLTSTDDSGVKGVLSTMGSGVLRGFESAAGDPARIALDDRALNLGADIEGVRALALAPTLGPEPLLLVVAQGTPVRNVRTRSFLFAVAPDLSRIVSRVDLTSLTDASFAIDLALTPAGDAAVITRSPDSVARLALRYEAGYGLVADLGAVSGTCRRPVAVQAAQLNADGQTHDRIVVTCSGDDMVQSLDAHTLVQDGAVRFFGRTPYEIAIDAANARAYVSHFADDSIGVFSLLSTDGTATDLRAVGRIGAQRDRLDDGRE